MKVTFKIGNYFPKVRNLLEVKFSKKPEEDVRESLRAVGVKWHNEYGIWYTKPENRALIESIIFGGVRFQKVKKSRYR